MKSRLLNLLNALSSPVARVWAWPVAMGLASTGGLMAALLGDGTWDAVSWCLLGWPVGVCLWFGLPRPALRMPIAWPNRGKTFSRQGI